ncbi:MAG: non-heme chloroperoxidase [Streptosporangiaceae bacterium]|nr:non-heme chloroperoxidase [Streptosporangiaceae bacterium]
MPFLTTSDGCDLFFSDWGDPHGRPVVFAHAWALSGDMWHQQIPDLAEAGLRCVVYDRRGHGRSDRPGRGYDLDTLAADLAALVNHLDLTDAVLVGHSLGASEVVRYVTNTSADRVAGIVLSAPTLPALLRTEDNPDGTDRAVFEESWRAMRADIGAWMTNLTNGDFNEYFGTAKPMSDDLGSWTRRQIVETPLIAAMASQRSVIEADFRPELRSLDLPTLIIQGDADTSLPLELTGRPTAALVPDSKLVVIEGAGHGLYASAAARYNSELLHFISACPAKQDGAYQEPQAARQ